MAYLLFSFSGILELLLEKRPELIDLTDSDGNNALHYAAQKNAQRAVEMLLGKRSELAYKGNLEHLSPLHIAAHYGSTDAIKALLLHCPDVVEMADSYGRNAFHASVISNKSNALKCLLRHVHPAELLNRVDGAGETPLHVAAKMTRISAVTCALMLIKDHRVDPCIRNRDGQTARSLVEEKLSTGEIDTYEMYLLKKLKQQESKRCQSQNLPPPSPSARPPPGTSTLEPSSGRTSSSQPSLPLPPSPPPSQCPRLRPDQGHSPSQP
jgi:hypothetical protein